MISCSFDPERLSYAAVDEALAYYEPLLQLKRPVACDSVNMKTSGGRRYVFGPNWQSLAERLMCFIFSEGGVRINKRANGDPCFAWDKTEYALFILEQSGQPIVQNNGFFTGCASVQSGPQEFEKYCTDNGIKAVIAGPRDIEVCYDMFTRLASGGVRIFSTFDPLGESLAMNFVNDTSSHICDYCIAWDSGLVFYTCQYGIKHLNPVMCALHKNNGDLLERFPAAISKYSSLFNYAQRFLCWESGDVIEISDDVCRCGRAWRCNFMSRRDNSLLWRDVYLSLHECGIDPPPGIQVYQDCNGRVALRYDQPATLVAYKDDVKLLVDKLHTYFASVEIQSGIVRRGRKISYVYSDAVRKRLFSQV